MKENNNFDEQFEGFAYNRFTSNTTEEIEELETDFNNICSKIERQIDTETKKLLEYQNYIILRNHRNMIELVVFIYTKKEIQPIISNDYFRLPFYFNH